MRPPKTPADLVRRFAAMRARERAEEFAKGRSGEPARTDGWVRESFRQSRDEAARTAKVWFERYPKESFRTEVERWRVDGDVVEFTMRRLVEADAPGAGRPAAPPGSRPTR